MQLDNAIFRKLLSNDLTDVMIRVGLIAFVVVVCVVSGGIIGLFVGAVFLAVGYQVFMEWVDEADASTSAEPEDAEIAAETSPAGE